MTVPPAFIGDRATASTPPAFADTLLGLIVIAVGNIPGLCGVLAMAFWTDGMMALADLPASRAGLIGSAYIGGSVVGTFAMAPMVRRVNQRLVAGAGFLGMAVMLAVAGSAHSFTGLIVPMALAGLSGGIGVATIHATAAQSRNPPRVFALMNYGLVAFAVSYFVLIPQLKPLLGPGISLRYVAGWTAAAAIVAALALPASPGQRSGRSRDAAPAGRIGVPVILAILGFAIDLAGQSTLFSFNAGIGKAYGFSEDAIGLALAATPIVNTVTPALAAILAGRLPALAVAATAASILVIPALAISLSSSYAAFAFSVCALTLGTSFAGSFMLGLIATLDPSGRSSAAMPAFMMLGSTVGPALGGQIADRYGFDHVGFGAASLIALAACCYWMLWLGRSGLRTAVIQPAGSGS